MEKIKTNLEVLFGRTKSYLRGSTNSPISTMEELNWQINDKQTIAGAIFDSFQKENISMSNDFLKEVFRTIEISSPELVVYAKELEASKAFMKSLFVYYILLFKYESENSWTLACTVDEMYEIGRKMLERDLKCFRLVRNHTKINLMSNILQKIFNQALELIRSRSDSDQTKLKSISLCLYCIGSVSFLTENYPEAADYVKKGIENMNRVNRPSSHKLYAQLHYKLGLAHASFKFIEYVLFPPLILVKFFKCFKAIYVLISAKYYFSSASDINEKDRTSMKHLCDKSLQENFTYLLISFERILLLVLFLYICFSLLLITAYLIMNILTHYEVV